MNTIFRFLFVIVNVVLLIYGYVILSFTSDFNFKENVYYEISINGLRVLYVIIVITLIFISYRGWNNNKSLIFITLFTVAYVILMYLLGILL